MEQWDAAGIETTPLYNKHCKTVIRQVLNLWKHSFKGKKKNDSFHSCASHICRAPTCRLSIVSDLDIDSISASIRRARAWSIMEDDVTAVKALASHWTSPPFVFFWNLAEVLHSSFCQRQIGRKFPFIPIFGWDATHTESTDALGVEILPL